MNWLDGQARRRWLNEQDARLGNALRYYLGPAAAPVNALAQAGALLSPGADMMDMAQSSGDVVDYQGPLETASDLGWLGAATLGMALPGNALAMREGAEELAERGIRAFHGSPHDFDAFSMDKIGTGEGAQAYGHGLYFAENEGVARSYRDALSRDRLATNDGAMFDVSTIGGWDDFEENYLTPLAEAAPPLPRNDDSFTDNSYEYLIGQAYENAEAGKDFAEEMRNSAAWLRDKAESEVERLRGYPMKPGTLNVLRQQYLQAAEFADSLASGSAQSVPGHMYEVRINANPDDFLDWDTTGVYKQPPKVKEALERMGIRAQMPNASGEAIYGELASRGKVVDTTKELSRQAATALREAGIPGIRYLDQGSRSAGEGSRNYVVFDDNLIEIMRKYGLLGMIGGGTVAGNALRPDDDRT